jgi:riboflavin synthase
MFSLRNIWLMFTGLIEDLGEVESLEKIGGDIRLLIKPAAMNIYQVQMGDSIAINGICLTVVSIENGMLGFDASQETIKKTSLVSLKKGSLVNLEQAMAVGDRLGGHMVSGHVDSTTSLMKVEKDARSMCLYYRFPDGYAHYIAQKGSICIDGVSLTVNEVTDQYFTVNIIPHTWKNTVMKTYQIGQCVNIEIDVIARYLERFLQCGASKDSTANQNTLGYNDLLKL